MSNQDRTLADRLDRARQLYEALGYVKWDEQPNRIQGLYLGAVDKVFPLAEAHTDHRAILADAAALRSVPVTNLDAVPESWLQNEATARYGTRPLPVSYQSYLDGAEDAVKYHNERLAASPATDRGDEPNGRGVANEMACPIPNCKAEHYFQRLHDGPLGYEPDEAEAYDAWKREHDRREPHRFVRQHGAGLEDMCRRCHRSRSKHPPEPQHPQPEPAVEPVPMVLSCPKCGVRHVDEDEWARRLHQTHRCANCGHHWRPFEYATVGIGEEGKCQACFVVESGRCVNHLAQPDHAALIAEARDLQDRRCPHNVIPYCDDCSDHKHMIRRLADALEGKTHHAR